MWILLAILVIIIAVLVYEIRLKKPDQIVLYEKDGVIRQRKTRYYPRHYSMPISGKTYSLTVSVEGSTKGRLDIIVKLIVTVGASLENLNSLVRVGGWEFKAIANASREIEVVLLGLVKEFTEKYEIEELSGEKLSDYIQSKTGSIPAKFGIEIISASVQSIDPVDKKIAEAMKKKETARILEQTETENQKVRVAAAQTRIQADEQIAFAEHQLELKKFDLKKIEEEKEAELAQLRVESEMKRKKINMELDREEMALLKENPELILLTPQIARLAEASQNLKNARTVVSLSPGDVEQGAGLMGSIHSILQNIIYNTAKRIEEKNNGEGR